MSDTIKLGGPPSPQGRKFHLASIPEARQAVADLINDRNDEAIDDGKYRSLVWGLSQLLAFFRLEKDIEIESRLEAIEAALEARR